MKTTKIVSFVLAATIASVSLSGTALAKKTKLQTNCASCHALATGASEKGKKGPNLVGIIGRKAGTVAGFTKYKAMKGADFVWTEDLMDEWIANQRKFLKAHGEEFKLGKKTTMAKKVKKEKTRKQIIEDLKNIK
ncbi:MAG: hypothetical protein COB46_07445 [Rhodospirillaceae bacterium]|nr:MAG: hypothetical protein COB46_07445 [Rhodospirillaceae bacterium]